MPLEYGKLEEAAKRGGFFSYVSGAVAVVLSQEAFKSRLKAADQRPLPGLHIDNYSTTLPMQKGLSSSAAICVLVALSLSRFYSLDLSQAQVMECAYLGEMVKQRLYRPWELLLFSTGNSLRLVLALSPYLAIFVDDSFSLWEDGSMCGDGIACHRDYGIP